MKIQNLTSHAIEIGDILSDSVNQWQSGIKRASLAPNGSANDTDKVVIADTVAGESAALASLLADGSVGIVGGDQALGGNAVPGVLGGKGGGPAFMGIVKTARLESAVAKFRIMFGVPVAGDEIVDLVIAGYDIVPNAGSSNVKVVTPVDINGTITAAAVAYAAVSKNVIVTYSGASASDQAGCTIWAKQA
jgi:hypothetical protein